MPTPKKPVRKNVLSAISELAEAVGARFDRVDTAIGEFRDEVDDRFSTVDRRLNDLQEQITRIETYILKDHERRLEILERKRG